MSRSRASRSTSRVPLSRAQSRSSIIVFPGGAESLIVPDGHIGALAADSEPLNITHESEATSSTLLEETSDDVQKKRAAGGEPHEVSSVGDDIEDDTEEAQEWEEMRKRPFYKRPSPWWVLGTMLLTAIAMSTTIAPRVELYTTLVCRVIKPEYTVESSATGQSWGSVGIVPPPSKRCGKDPEIQAAVARLITFMTVFPGILSCLTTGWWGQLSDRYGRTWILGIATIGVLVTDFNFILVSRAADRLPGGYLFLIVGPTFDGLLGGMTTIMAGLHAYLSDCTSAGDRSHYFSMNTGLLFCGMAVGPALGGLLVQRTNDLLSVFYLATASHMIYGFAIWFIVPESLPKASMRKARKRREIQHSEGGAGSVSSSQRRGYAIWGRMADAFKTIFTFLAPLSIFIPSKRPDGKGRDWNLLLMVFSFAFYGMLMGSYQFKFQYAQRVFGWGSEVLGYWLSVVSIARATYLVLILPLLIRLFKPRPAPIQLPVSPQEPLQSSSESSRSPSRHRTPRHTAFFDLNLARASLSIEILCYVGMALAVNPATWTVASVAASFGGGFSPALQSVALALYEQGPNKGIETGRLFGGLSVVQSLSAQIIGPSVFGFTYMSTVNTFPPGIFVVAAGVVACALLFMSLIRLIRGHQRAGHDREETAVDPDDRA